MRRVRVTHVSIVWRNDNEAQFACDEVVVSVLAAKHCRDSLFTEESWLTTTEVHKIRRFEELEAKLYHMLFALKKAMVTKDVRQCLGQAFLVKLKLLRF